MSQAIAAYLHYLSIFALFALLSIEHVLLKPDPTLAQARSLIRVDLWFGIVAGTVLLTGLARVLWFAKGPDYYLHNGFFHAKVALFVLIGLMSIVPTVRFLGWRPAVKAGVAPTVSAASVRQMIMIIRLELALLVLVPLPATLMARGLGTF
jgi:putative membrane protein